MTEYPPNKSREWFDAHSPYLRANHADKYVMIVDEKIVDTDPNLDDLVYRSGKLAVDASSFFIGFAGIEKPRFLPDYKPYSPLYRA